MDIKDFLKIKNRDFFLFRGRDELVQIMLKKYFHDNKKHNLKILNVGCGVGDTSKVDKFGRQYFIDISDEVIDLLPKNKKKYAIVGDISKRTKFKSDMFDLIVATSVLEHIKNHHKAVKEFKRLVKKDGYFLVSVPVVKSMYSAHDKALGHYRRYDKNTLLKLFSRLKVEEIFYWNSILFPAIWFKRMFLDFGKKKKPVVDVINLPKVVNRLFFYILHLENIFIKNGIRLFPIGVNLVVIIKNEK